MNINQNNQYGNNNINIGNQQRTLDSNLKSQLKAMLNKSEPIEVSGALGDGEACIFAEEIRSYLADEGYDVENGISQSVWMPAIKGQQISPDLINGKKQIMIGHQ